MILYIIKLKGLIMAVKKRKLPSKYIETEKSIYKLVSEKGVSKAICINTLQLPVNYFNILIGTNENYNKALAHFTSEVLMKSVIENLAFDSTSRKYIMQKLRVFDSEIELPVKKMTSAKHASENLSFALNAYAKKEIGDESLVAIRSACSVFSDLMVATTLQAEVEELKKMFEEKFNEDSK